jgi:hypothetical protein
MGERLLMFRLLPSVTQTTIATMQGDFAAADRALASTLEQVARLEMPAARDGNASVLMLLPLLGYQGRAHMLEPMVEGIASSSAETLLMVARAQFALERGEAEVAARRWAPLRAACFGEAAGGRRTVPSPLAMVGMAEVACAVGDEADAEAVYAMLRPFEKACATEGIAVCVGSFARPMGELANKLGRFDRAEEHLRLALATNRHHRPERARTELALARTLLATGRRDHARSHVLSARAEAESMGMAPLVAAAERMRRAIGA